MRVDQDQAISLVIGWIEKGIKEITIFGTPNALKTLRAKGILEGKHNSFFMGETQVRFEDFSNIKTIDKFKDCYYIGGQSQQEAMRLFKASLTDKYGGGLPKLFSSDKETWLSLLAVWSIVFVLILLLTIYEIISMKKEIIVRITLGEDVRTFFSKNALVDIGILASAFLSVPFILSTLSNVLFKMQALALAFLVLIIANTLINAVVLRVNFKKDIATRRSGGGLLTASYILKTITTILALIVLSSNFAVLVQGYLMYKQRDFFSEHKDYSYYQLNYKVNNHLGKTNSQAGKAMYYAYSTMYNIPEQDYNNFIGEYQLSNQIVVKSNVLDVYEHNWEIISRNMKLVVVLSVLLLALEIALISFIIKLEYQFNAMEMALKKVFGYSFYARNKRLILITLVVFLMSVILGGLLRGFLGIAEGIGLDYNFHIEEEILR